MRSIHRLVTGLVLAPFAIAAPEAERPDPCTPGVWQVTSKMYSGGGETSSPATSTVTCLFDGAVEMAEYRSFAPNGAVWFRGVSFHVWNAEHTERTTLWAMVGDPGYTVLTERMVDGVLHSEGEGSDRAGAFLETSVTTFDDDYGYRFEMNRSYDGGQSWAQPFNVIDAVRTDREPPAPVALAPPIRQAREAVGASGDARSILDGLAQVVTRTETVADSARRTIRYSSRYARPDRWRTLVWEVGAPEAAVEERLIGKPR